MARTPRLALKIAATATLLTVLGVGTTFAVMGGFPFMFRQPPAPPPVVPPASAVMPALGYSAEALAAAGVTAEVAGQLATDFRSHLGTNWAAMLSARETLTTRESSVASLTADRRAGKGVSAETMSAAAQQATEARAAWQTHLAAARAIAANRLTEGQQAVLDTIAANKNSGLPVQYRVVSRTADEWLALRNDLAAKAYRESRGETVPAEVTSRIATADADSRVSAAVSNLVQQLTAVRSAINAAADAP